MDTLLYDPPLPSGLPPLATLRSTGRPDDGASDTSRARPDARLDPARPGSAMAAQEITGTAVRIWLTPPLGGRGLPAITGL
jgi:hypothetical protein